ncbi:MAG TPA: FAD-dependent monooxygenase [Patescibacteria group bacterium]
MNQRILIIGAGLGGLALYKALDKNKFTVHLADKRRELGSLGYGILFYPIGGYALRRLGFSSDFVQNLGKSYSQYYFRNEDATLRDIIDYSSVSQEFGDYKGVSRGDLYKPLFADINSDDLLLGNRVVGMSESSNEVQVTFEDGTIRTYDFVIGADGAHSTVRQSILPDSQLEKLGATFMWTWVLKSELEAIPPRPTLYFGEKANLGVLDVNDPERVVAFCWFTEDALGREASHEEWNDYIKEHFSSFGGIVPSVLRSLYKQHDRFVHRDYQLKLPTWHKGRVGLIGDAAHALSALTGLGSALALEDGAFLAELFNKTDDLGSAFQHFENIQRPRTINVKLEDFATTEGSLSIMREIFSSSPLR